MAVCFLPEDYKLRKRYPINMHMDDVQYHADISLVICVGSKKSNLSKEIQDTRFKKLYLTSVYM